MAKEKVEQKVTQTDSEKKLAIALDAINKKFGAGSAMALGDDYVVDMPRVSTGIIGVDNALGGGFAKGRIIEIYGEESCFKTSLALMVAAMAQKAGGTVGMVDMEHALDPVWAAKLGVDVAKLVVSQPDDGNTGLEITEMLVRDGGCSVVIVDSVAALTPRQELDGDYGDSLPGLQARLMSQGMRKLVGIVAKSDCCLIFINQKREKIGVMFGDPTTTAGGRALKFYASTRVDMTKNTSGQLKDGDNVIGQQFTFKTVKNKTAPPFQKYTFSMYFDYGFSREAELISLGVEYGFVDKAGAWFSYNGEKLGQGAENARQKLIENPEIANELEQKIRTELGIA